MPDSEAKKEWMRANTTMVTVKMTNKGDADILRYLDGKAKATVIKAALREYMKNHPDRPFWEEDETPKEYRYGMRLRGYSPGAQPKGVLRREDDQTGRYHDIIVYDRQLSADEIRAYELDEMED